MASIGDEFTSKLHKTNKNKACFFGFAVMIHIFLLLNVFQSQNTF